MNFSGIFIKRPVLAIVVSILIVLFGIIGYSFLGVREYPSIDPPVVTVSTSYPGANAEVIESQITEPLEESINGIAGIRTLTSSSRDGGSSISVEFQIGTDMEAAANDVRDRVSRAQRSLPPDVDPPRVTKSDADASPVMGLTVQSDKRNLLQLSEIANNLFKERLQTTPGVSEVRIWGEKKYAIKLFVDPLKLAGYHLTPSDIRDAVNRENIELPSGTVEGYGTELSVRTIGRLSTKEQFDNLIIREVNGTLVRFKDIGHAELMPENEKSIMRGNGKIPMVGLAIIPQPGSNQIQIVDEVKKRLEQIKREMPEDIAVGVSMDTTLSIRKAISEVQETILIAFVLVSLIIFLFLREWRTTVIPVVAIPISLIGSFFIMYIAGYTINILTLLSIVLATGLVVDDAIVVLENIYTKIEKGMTPVEAGFKGSKEIFFAIISTTITLAAVFLPIIFLQGLTGQLFREFGVVMAGSVLISAVVSLTLTPMLASHWLRHQEHHNRFYTFTEPFFEGLISLYNRSLRVFFRNRWMAFVMMLFALGLVAYMWPRIPGELAPMEDKSRLSISATAPEGVSFEKMDAYMQQMLNIVDTLPEKESYMALTSWGNTNSGFIRVTLVPPAERQRSQQQIADFLSGQIRPMTFARSFVTQEQTIGGGRMSGLPVQFVVQATSLEKLREEIPKFMDKAQNDPVFQVVDLNLKFNKPEMTLRIDRDRARTLGLTLRDIAETLQLFFGGQRMGFFILNSKQYQIICQADRQYRDQPLDLKTVYVRNKDGVMIQLDNVVKADYQVNLPQLYRFNRYISATVSASTAPGYTLGQGIDEMHRIAKETLDDTFTTSLTGVSRDYEESSNTLVFAFMLALILIYLILSAQFESFRDPLVIMFTVPLAIAGALLSLKIFGQTLNIFSQIGMIMLIGIVTKNSILIVEFANQKKYAGMDIRQAAVEAATQRFRPIVMTSLSTVLGALPIALALGAGARSRVSMGIVIIGGLLFALVLTLYVIPSLYTFISGTKKKFESKES
jgi:multidrug efflux pump